METAAKQDKAKRYELTVITPLPENHSLMSIFEIEVNQGLEWVRQHADELARTVKDGALSHYTALNVRALA